MDTIKLLKLMRQLTTKGPPETLVTKILASNGSKGRPPEFLKSRRKEIAGLLGEEQFDVVMKENIPKGANILGGRFVLALKNLGTK